MKAIKHEVHKEYQTEYFSVLIKDKDIKVWVDVSIYNKGVEIDWNKYIFHLTDEDDVRIKQYQEDCNNFGECGSLAVSHLEEQGLIFQNDKGSWYVYPTKEEIIEEMELHNSDEVGIGNEWDFEDAEYHLLLSDKYYY